MIIEELRKKWFMIIEELTKLGEPKRKAAAVVTVLVVAGICYLAIARDSITKLETVKASYADVQTEYASTANQQTNFLNLQKQLGEKEKRLHEYQRLCFSSSGAATFFENINTMALACNLKPMSRAIAEPRDLVDDQSGDENAEPKPQFLKTQSVEITVAGNYFDIVDFVNQLTGSPQKVCITDLHVTLQGGKKAKPRASFNIALAIDLSKDTEK